MFEEKRIKYIRIIDNSLFIKYSGEHKKFLTSGKVDLDDFIKKQKKWLKKPSA